MSIKREASSSPPRTKQIRINEQIRTSPVRLIDVDGKQLGIISAREALEIAQERQLDLVEIAPNANPPVCRVLDFGKYRYELTKKERSSKKQASSQIKGIRLSPKIGEHDFMVKAEAARKFLIQGHKVKVSVIFRGRLITHKEFGEVVMNKLAEVLSDIAKVEASIKMEGARNMVMILSKK
ncbi:MAG: translation initiation factor IF-3 [bacterium]